MTEPLIIDGWRCELRNGRRHAQHPKDAMSFAFFDDNGLRHTGYCAIPPGVLLWLIRPLLHEAWQAGWNQASAEFRGGSETMANPHKDPTNG